MSNKLKDARWRLAEGYAEEDGIDIYDFPGPVTEGYLNSAQKFLEEHGTSEMIEALASAFRREEK